MNHRCRYIVIVALIMLTGISCHEPVPEVPAPAPPDPALSETTNHPHLVILGIAQDAGYPQAGCRKACCERVQRDPGAHRMATCLALIDPARRQRWMFEATPDFPGQLSLLDELAPPAEHPGINGIFLTHGHIGHYAGLMHLGREAMGASRIPVFAMPRMRAFLSGHGPWSQLVQLENIHLVSLAADSVIKLSDSLYVTPLQVPHRDEFTETVGFIIRGPRKSALFIPDIDKWSKWEQDIKTLIRQVDYALLDATFFANGEIPGRDMTDIPHPFIEESLEAFRELPATEKDKIYFIHLNHTNPALDPGGPEAQRIRSAGYHLAEEQMRLPL